LNRDYTTCELDAQGWPPAVVACVAACSGRLRVAAWLLGACAWLPVSFCFRIAIHAARVRLRVPACAAALTAGLVAHLDVAGKHLHQVGLHGF
jgi:hypothetical protein